MQQEIMTPEQCERLISVFKLPDLRALACARRDRDAAFAGGLAPMAIVRAFCFGHPEQKGTERFAAIILALAPGDPRAPAYKGFYSGQQCRFAPKELPDALAALAEMSATYGQQFIRDDLLRRFRPCPRRLRAR